MITYKFITQDKSQDIEAMSLKKAMISFNTKAGDAKDVYNFLTEYCKDEEENDDTI